MEAAKVNFNKTSFFIKGFGFLQCSKVQLKSSEMCTHTTVQNSRGSFSILVDDTKMTSLKSLLELCCLFTRCIEEQTTLRTTSHSGGL